MKMVCDNRAKLPVGSNFLVCGTVSSCIAVERESLTSVLNWEPPQDPNGEIIAYEVMYRVNNTDNHYHQHYQTGESY